MVQGMRAADWHTRYAISFRSMLEETAQRTPGKATRAAKPYDEIIDFIAAGTTPEAVVAFRPSGKVQARVAELVDRSEDGSISPEEQSELEDYLQLEHIMIMAKARARRHTQLAK